MHHTIHPDPAFHQQNPDCDHAPGRGRPVDWAIHEGVGTVCGRCGWIIDTHEDRTAEPRRTEILDRLHAASTSDWTFRATEDEVVALAIYGPGEVGWRKQNPLVVQIADWLHDEAIGEKEFGLGDAAWEADGDHVSRAYWDAWLRAIENHFGPILDATDILAHLQRNGFDGADASRPKASWTSTGGGCHAIVIGNRDDDDLHVLVTPIEDVFSEDEYGEPIDPGTATTVDFLIGIYHPGFDWIDQTDAHGLDDLVESIKALWEDTINAIEAETPA